MKDKDDSIPASPLLKNFLTDEPDSSLQNQSFDELKIFLQNKISRLIETDVERLLQIMYRIDIDEEKFKRAFDSEYPAEAIADLIIAREMKRQETLRNFKP